MFNDFDDFDFDDLGMRLKPKAADLVMTTIKMGRSQTERVQFNFAPAILEEIRGSRYSIGFAVSRRSGVRAFRIKADDAGRFEATKPGRGDRRLLRCPLPPVGVVWAEGSALPEFYVDRVGRQILVEVPDLFLQKVRALPKPDYAAGGDHRPGSASRRDDEEVRIAVDRRIKELLGANGTMPRVIGGLSFTPSEREILATLLSHSQVSRDGLLAACHDPEKGEDDRDPQIVSVFLSKMKPRLTRLGISIENIGGGAFRMPLDSKTRLRALAKENEA